MTKQADVPPCRGGGEFGIKLQDLTAPWRFNSFSHSEEERGVIKNGELRKRIPFFCAQYLRFSRVQLFYFGGVATFTYLCLLIKQHTVTLLNALALVALILNARAYYLMYADKQNARKQTWRTPERNLLLSALFFGSIGILLGMQAPLYHKRRKWYFWAAAIGSLALQIGLLGWAWNYLH